MSLKSTFISLGVIAAVGLLWLGIQGNSNVEASSEEQGLNKKADQAEASKDTKAENAKSKSPKKGVKFFEGSWEEAKTEAEDKGKPIFVDAYTTWCGPCKMMNKRVFPRKSVGNFYNDKFINFKFDMESKTGRKFKRDYQVKGYPTFLYFDKEGNVIHRKMGFIGPKRLIKHGKKALNKKNDS